MTPQHHAEIVSMVKRNHDIFPDEFYHAILGNSHVYEAFEREALSIVGVGFKHYSARTIIEFLRHHSSTKESDGAWKLNDHACPYLSRLFALLNPTHADLFAFRETNLEKAAA